MSLPDISTSFLLKIRHLGCPSDYQFRSKSLNTSMGHQEDGFHPMNAFKSQLCYYQTPGHWQVKPQFPDLHNEYSRKHKQSLTVKK